MITPPRRALDHFVTSTIPRFLEKHGGMIDPQSDSARLQNLVRFLKDVTKTLRYMHARQWSVRQELFDMRHTEEYRTGRGTYDQRGDRESSSQDLVTVTLEILARPVTKAAEKQGPKIVVDPVAKAGEPQRAAFCKAWQKLVKTAFTEALKLAGEQALAQARTQARVPPGAADSFEMAEGRSPVLRAEMDQAAG
ncbi:hypothetical protein EDB89DRAFT_1957255 [Lactarius sanguifluus]|nr:hypothetical protein EDB89DRAFT_1957255 [Lactarius sanguifluus]